MSEISESVKKISLFMRHAADRLTQNSQGERAAEYDGYAESLEAAFAELNRLSDLTAALPHDLGNLHDLPPELLKELSISKTDELEDQLVTVINAYGGTATLDQVLVGLYNKFTVSQKRRFCQNKLYRMTKAELIWSAGKGIYTTVDPDRKEVGYEKAYRDYDEAFGHSEDPF